MLYEGEGGGGLKGFGFFVDPYWCGNDVVSTEV